jgi:hypothetical protein
MEEPKKKLKNIDLNVLLIGKTFILLLLFRLFCVLFLINKCCFFVCVFFSDLDISTISDIDSQLSESFNEVLSDANLLDSSASKSKCQLASSGVMASRRPPSKRNKVGKNQIHESV